MTKKCQSQDERLNVVVCAFACSPYQGSEDGVGWNIVSRLGKHHNVTVLYGDCGGDDRRKREVDRWLAQHGAIPGVRFCYIAPTKFGKGLLNIAHYGKQWCPPLVFVYYYSYRSWLRQACRFALQLHQQHPYDIAHQLTYISYREPGYLWRLTIPFVWGPIAGAVDMPWRFYRLFSLATAVRFVFRSFANYFQRRGNCYIRSAFERSSKIWAVSDEDLRMVRKRWGMQAEWMPETGTSPNQDYIRRRPYGNGGKLVLLWSGTHEGGKALPLLLHALAEMKQNNRVRLLILGDGSESVRWRRKATRLGISHLIDWKGYLSHEQAKATMGNADVFVFTSLKEATSTVIMEALSCGLPVICHDACGMAKVIDQTCGLKVPMECPRKSIEGFRKAIEMLLDSAILQNDLSVGALARAEQLSWEKKAEHIAKTYRNVLSRSRASA